MHKETLAHRGAVASKTNIEFYSKNKFENLVHLVGFIIRIYHDARSHERQIDCMTYTIAVFTVKNP